MKSFFKLSLFLLFLLPLPSAKAAILTLYLKNATCGNNNGYASVTATGFTWPMTFTWSNGDTISVADSLAPGNYTLHVTDAAGLSDSAAFDIFNDTLLSNAKMSYLQPGSLTVGNYPCKLNCNGIAYLDIDSMNGTGPYSIVSSLPGHTNGMFTPGDIPTLENVCLDDIYTVIVTDANGCTGNAIPTPVEPVVYFEFSRIVAPACNGSSNGTVSCDFYLSNGHPYFLTCTDSIGNTISGTLAYQHITLPGFHPGNYSCVVSDPWSAQGCDSTFTLFMPDAGPDCGLIYGTVFSDTMINCIQDPDELPVAFQIVEITPGPYYATTDSAGNFRTQIPLGTYDVAALGTANLWFTCQPLTVSLPLTGDSAQADLGLGSLGPDIEITLTGSPAIPGEVMTQYILIKNTSYYTSGIAPLELYYDSLIVFDSLSIPVDMSWPGYTLAMIPSLNRMEELLVKAYYTVPGDTANVGYDVVTTVGSASGMGWKADTLVQMIDTATYGNRLFVLPSDDPLNTFIPGTDNEIRYIFNFENTTANQLNSIVLNDTLSNLLDFATLRVVGYSHTCSWSLSRANILRVEFPSINLPTTGMERFGQFAFGIKPKRNIPMPSTINNSLVVYLDTLTPFQSNSVISTVDLTATGLESVSAGRGLMLYPNPVSDALSIRLTEPETGIAILKIYSPDGRLLLSETKKDISAEALLYVSDLGSGVYLLQVEVNNKYFISRFIKTE